MSHVTPIDHTAATPMSRRSTVLMLAVAMALHAGTPAAAQETETADAGASTIEEITVTGIRETVRSTIDIKRDSVQIVDGLSSNQIGDIPALSVGDALETITGATSHQENGGATELSIRGLGPYLGTTVVNGREATNGGGNRAVNFSIFPSEMFNKIAIHKTQSAEYIEGAVSGQVHLDTKKPLVFGKRFFQVDVKAAHSPDEADITGGQDFGSRATLAYIDSFDLESGARLGLSIGAQIRDESNPEQEYTTTSGQGRLEACELTSFASNALPTDTTGRCDDGSAAVNNRSIQALIDANPNYNSVEDIPFAYIPRDHRYRQNTTSDEREALFGAIQFQPIDRVDILLDFQYSERDQRELRRDLQWGSTQEDISALTSNPATGVVRSSVSETVIHSFTTDWQRLEEYGGLGINLDYAISDSLMLNLDYAWSDTTRTETDYELRLGATHDNLVGGNRDDFTVRLDTNQGDAGVAIATILDDGGNGFEITDPSYFNARDRARLRARQIIRENTLNAFRADLTWLPDGGPFQNVKAGMRLSSLEYVELGGLRNAPGQSLFEDEDLVTPNGGADNAVTDSILSNVLACANASFPESGFLSDVRNGNLITNSGSGTSVNEFATFNFGCAANAWLANYGGLSGVQLQNGINSGTEDVTEDTLAFYVQADFNIQWGGIPIRGNLGARFVDTEITSVGYRGPITVEEIDGVGFIVTEGDASVLGFETETQKNSYQEILPSLTVVADVADDWIVRGGIYRGLSRPDPASYGNGRAIQDNDLGNAYTTLSEAVNGIGATGNPQLEPLLSTNVDLGVEWYPNESTMIAGSVYWKDFNGGFETVAQLETFNLDGNLVQGTVETTQVNDDTSRITGFEATLIHDFDYLPGFLSGFGGKLSYNYVDSNFEFEDQNGGDGVDAIDQQTGQVIPTQLIGIIPPANLFGLSRKVSSAQLYWSSDRWYVQMIHNRRSGYFQQFTRDAFGRIRYTQASERLDLRVRYRLTDNFRVSLEAKNILNEERLDDRAIEGNTFQALSYGPRLFLGVTAKF